MTESSHSDDVAFIRALAEVLREHDMAEIQVKRDYGTDASLNVRLTKVAAAPATPAWAAPLAPASAPAAAAPVPEVPDPAIDDPASHPGAVASPMVGTAYLSAEPGAAPFVAVGQSVREGETLLIVEAMKTMNQIPAPRSGTVTRILVGDGTPVEYGAPLMILE